MGARYNARYANVVVIGGVVRDAEEQEPTPHSGGKARAWLENECEENAYFNVRVQLLALGHNAAQLLALAKVEAHVDIIGSLTTVKVGGEFRLCVSVNKIIEL